ncbi:MAG: hypothetical protein IT367_05710 [Candidatus Hydrogenedentes bacterium]|nr:hypothetical protein [Candidatus Hydrogenedentota bacterium]
MKKSDVLIATVLGLLVSAVAIWFAQPKWYKDLAEEIREWREPRRPSMLRYIDRERMRREERDENGRSERESDGTQFSSNAITPQITFAVVDTTTNKPVTAFRYRRSFAERRPGDPPQDIPWNTVSNNLGTFELVAERTYEPSEPPRDKTVTRLDIWKSAIELEKQRRRAQSDTLEVTADGYEMATVPLFGLINDEDSAVNQHVIRLVPAAGMTEKEFELAEQQRRLGEMAEKERSAQGPLQMPQGQASSPEKEKAILSGVITFGDKLPHSGVVRFHSPSAATYQEIELSLDGTYEIAGLHPGDGAVTVRATIDGTNWREHREIITIKDFEPTQFNYNFLMALGSLTGTLTGLLEGESGGIFAIKGDYTLRNVTEDDLYDLGEICDGEARPNQEGVFTIRELEEGKYTIIAIAERHAAGKDPVFLYVSGTVEIKAGEKANIALSLN